MIDDGAKNEILQAIAALDAKLTGRIDGLEGKIGDVEIALIGRMDALHEEAMDAIQMLSSSTDERFNELDAKIDGVEQRLDAKIERTRVEMPTKDYIDRKFADYDKDASERAERMFVRRQV